LYYEIKHHQGKLWNGLKLPLFRTIQKNYLTFNGEEIDLYCETLRGKKRVFELKYQGNHVGNKEIGKMLKKLEADRYVIVSKAGFSHHLDQKYLQQENLYLIKL
jgi:hypothetical protein